MTRPPVIEVQDLSKTFRNVRLGNVDTSLRELLRIACTRPWRLLLRGGARGGADIDALQPTSFAVQPGDRLGIIGRNGSGKSTLLKILSGITPPSAGRAVLRGRSAAILEVGTGFHPDLTGAENIFLGGAILGMRRRTIAARLEEIAAFAELEDFLDLAVKRYSSGMYVRLAFAIAACLESEILFVDEVLAVGDEGFRGRCLARMRSEAERGRTIVFVSHDMELVSAFCNRCLVLDRGRLVHDGGVDEAVRIYHELNREPSGAVPA